MPEAHTYSNASSYQLQAASVKQQAASGKLQAQAASFKQKEVGSKAL
jgi:hypothetical protein